MIFCCRQPARSRQSSQKISKIPSEMKRTRPELSETPSIIEIGAGVAEIHPSENFMILARFGLPPPPLPGSARLPSGNRWTTVAGPRRPGGPVGRRDRPETFRTCYGTSRRPLEPSSMSITAHIFFHGHNFFFPHLVERILWQDPDPKSWPHGKQRCVVFY